MFAVVGSGFGLYGYLPALVEAFHEPVLLPDAYREKVLARPELRPYVDSVRWVRDTGEALAQASAAVIATPPARQSQVVSQCAALPALDKLILEKPLAASPREAAELMARLRKAGKRFRVGYTLLHAEWRNALRFPEAGSCITWTFMAHHFAHSLQTWKREHAQGGGVLRFFGIHLLPLLVVNGYDAVVESRLAGEIPAEPERWEAVFSRNGRDPCRVLVDSQSPVSRFSIAAGLQGEGDASVRLDEPFQSEAPAPHGGDRRVRVLERLLHSLEPGQDAFHDGLYDRVNLLWQAVEAACEIRPGFSVTQP